MMEGLSESLNPSAETHRLFETGQHAPQLTPRPQFQRSRALRQQAPDIIEVRTAQELVTAVERGDVHIEIREHLDLTGISPLGNLDPGPVLLGEIPLSVQSIRGNCEGNPEGLSDSTSSRTPPIRPLAPRQCVLTVDMPLLHTPTQSARSVWLDGLYIRFQRTARSYRFNFGLLFVKWGSTQLWMTHMHLQGAGLPSGAGGTDCANCGLYQWGDVYMKDCKFSDMSGDMVLYLGRGETNAMHGCQFLDNTATKALIAAETRIGVHGAAARITRTTFANNTAPNLLQMRDWTDGAWPVYFTDAPVLVRYDGKGGDVEGETPSHTVTELPAGKVLANEPGSFLNDLQQELPEIPRTSESYPPVTTFGAQYTANAFSTEPLPTAPPLGLLGASGKAHESPPEASLSRGALAGVIVAAVVALILVVVAACCAWQRRRLPAPVKGNVQHKQHSPTARSEVDKGRKFDKGAVGSTSSNSRTSAIKSSSHSDTQEEQEGKAEGGEFLPGLPLLPPSRPSFNFLRMPSLKGSNRSMRREQSVGERTPQMSLRAEGLPDDLTKDSSLPRSYSNSAPASSSSNHIPPIDRLSASTTAAGAAAGAAAVTPALRKHMSCSDRQESRGSAQSANSANAKSYDEVDCDSYEVESTLVSYQETLRPLDEGAGRAERLEFLRRQLESLAGTTVCRHLGGLLVKDGSSSRVQGGQAVVQFAEHQINKVDYAMKFIVTRRTFVEESAQYTDPDNPLLRFLPQVHAIVDNEDGKLTDTSGNPLPPCIVMEKGESLDLWMMRNRRTMDTYTCMQIIHHICECLSDLHSGGYVHRDLKPGNVIWLPSQNRWTLIDFGCAAKQGEAARIGFSLPYAAPEVAKACYRDQQLTMPAHPSLDIWSLGVIAIELFSGRPALKVFKSQEAVIEQLVGEKPLPWEEEGTARALLARAARFRGAMLTLLHRDPAHRPSADAFMQHCHSLLASTTTGQD